ncbi:MAG: ATP-binding protein, partial [bacterium]
MLIKRDLQKSLATWLPRREIIFILGARQVGKTSLIRLLQQELSNEYLDLENPLNLNICESVEQFLAFLSQKGFDSTERTVCFLDEIQYHPDPTRFLKLLHDHHSHLKFIVTGSSAFDIRKKVKESLVGRKVTFTLHALNFCEFLRFSAPEYEQTRKQISLLTAIEDFGAARRTHVMTPRVLPLFEQFMRFGGYPAIVLEKDTEIKRTLLREIFATYVQKDIKDLAHISDPFRFNQLMTFLAVQAANLYKADEVAREIRLPQRSVENYVFVLEQTFTLARVRPFFSNVQKELTKMPKLYFMDNGLRNAILDDFRELHLRPDLGALAESVCFAELSKAGAPIQKINHWRTADGKEIDFVLTLDDKSLLPVEVKYQNHVKPEAPPAMKAFIK